MTSLNFRCLNDARNLTFSIYHTTPSVFESGIGSAPKSIFQIFETRSHLGIPDKTVLDLPLATHLRNLKLLLSNSGVDLREILLRSSNEFEATKRSSMYRLFSVSVSSHGTSIRRISAMNLAITKSAIKGLKLIPQTCKALVQRSAMQGYLPTRNLVKTSIKPVILNLGPLDHQWSIRNF